MNTYHLDNSRKLYPTLREPENLSKLFNYFSPMSKIIGLACIATHGVINLTQKNTTYFLKEYSLNASKVLNGEILRLLTYPFLHVNLIHLGLNINSLSQIGPQFEKKWGNLGCAKMITYAIAANLIGEALFSSSNSSSVGLSGVLCGMQGALIANKDKHKKIDVFFKNIISTLAFDILNSIALETLTGIRISHIGHISGYLAGLTFSLLNP